MERLRHLHGEISLQDAASRFCSFSGPQADLENLGSAQGMNLSMASIQASTLDRR